MGGHRKVAANKKVAFHMRVLIRSAGVALLGIVAAALSALTSTMTTVFTLAAATYIVGGTQFAPPFCVPFCGTLATPQQNIDLATLKVVRRLTAGKEPDGLAGRFGR